MFASDPAVESEYVVVAEVTLDADAIRARLETLGLVAAERPQGHQRVVLVVEGLRHYGPLAELRRLLLDDPRVRSADPVEFRRGRAVLAVDADRDAPGLVADLQRRAPEGLRIDVLDQGRDGATLRVESERTNPEIDTDGAGPGPRD
jgi:hypothetical protein